MRTKKVKIRLKKNITVKQFLTLATNDTYLNVNSIDNNFISKYTKYAFNWIELCDVFNNSGEATANSRGLRVTYDNKGYYDLTLLPHEVDCYFDTEYK